MQSTWGTSLGEDKLGATDKVLNTKVARRARAGQTFLLYMLQNGTLPPPCRSPPLVVPQGGVGTVTWSTQNFSLRLIVLASAKPPTKKANPPPKSAAQR